MCSLGSLEKIGKLEGYNSFDRGFNRLVYVLSVTNQIYMLPAFRNESAIILTFSVLRYYLNLDTRIFGV